MSLYSRYPNNSTRLSRSALTKTNNSSRVLLPLLFAIQNNTPPTITITGQSTSKISAEETKNNCVATFVSNQNLTQWEARAGGIGVGSGDLVASGGAVLAETEFSVYYSNLTWGDIVYRINVYGKNEAGVWSAYE